VCAYNDIRELNCDVLWTSN